MKSSTHYLLLVDASGSMSDIRRETLESINAQVRSIRSLAQEVPGQAIFVSLRFFNSESREVYTGLHPDQAPTLDPNQYRPSGSTALLDALGQCMQETSRRITPFDDVVVVVVTDGEENASQYYTTPQIASRIGALKESGRWTFSFIGADFDSWSVARQLNVDRSEVRNYRKADINLAMEDVCASMVDFIKEKDSGNRKRGFLKNNNEQKK